MTGSVTGVSPTPLFASLERSFWRLYFQASREFGDFECLKLKVTVLFLTLFGLGT